MKYNVKVDRIDIFDERWYSIEGEDVPNVTSYTDMYPKGLGYQYWLMNTKDPLSVRDEAAQIGSEVHRLIEDALNGVQVVYSGQDIRIWERFVSWFEWYKEFTKEHEVKTLGIEVICYDLELRYAGTCDWFCEVDGVKTVIDWKTGSFIGYTAELQVSAYAYALGAEQAIIVQLNTDLDASGKPKLNKKGFRVHPVKELERAFNRFKICIEDFWHENPNAKPKYKSLPTEIFIEEQK